MKKRSIALLLALVLAFSFVITACDAGGSSSSSSGGVSLSSSSSSASTDDGGEESDVETGEREVPWDRSVNDEIIVSVINPYYTKGWQVMAEQYTAMWPETTVTVDVVGSNDAYTQKMTTWLTADDLSNSGDIVHVNFAAGPVGGYDVMFQRDMIYDFREMLDDPNPYYNNTPVRDLFTPEAMQLLSSTEGMYSLPFDMVSVALIYNKTLLDEYGIAIPETKEDFVAACAALRDAGMQYPILASAEASYWLGALQDAALRDMEPEFIVLETDGWWNNENDYMAANIGFTGVTDANLEADRFVVLSNERLAIWHKEIVENPDNLDPKLISVYEEFRSVAQYFEENYQDSASSEIMTSFVASNAPFLLSGSWNIGSINKSVQELDDADKFEWGSLKFPDYATKMEGWASTILRTQYVPGNAMGIIKSRGDGDHLERVKDFYMFCYNPENAVAIYNATLEVGDFIQGPSAMIGVVLPDELMDKMGGFLAAGVIKAFFLPATLQADAGTGKANEQTFLQGNMTAEEYITTMIPLWKASYEDGWDKAQYDFDPTTKDAPKE